MFRVIEQRWSHCFVKIVFIVPVSCLNLLNSLTMTMSIGFSQERFAAKAIQIVAVYSYTVTILSLAAFILVKQWCCFVR